MTAHIEVTRYGNRTEVICDPCGLTERHDRHKPAAEAAAAHNRQEHP